MEKKFKCQKNERSYILFCNLIVISFNENVPLFGPSLTLKLLKY